MARKSRDDWTLAALRALTTGGVSSVRVEKLARDMEVTKGSFYHHFANRRELLDSILAFWEQIGTEQVIETVDAKAPDAAGRLLALAEIALFEDTDYDHVEFALRGWAVGDAVAAEVVARVDQRRLGYVHELLTAAGVHDDLAAERSHIFYRILIGEYAWRSYGAERISRKAVVDVIEALVR